MTSPIPKWRPIFEISSTILMILLAGTLVWQTTNRVRNPDATASIVPVPKEPIPVSAERILGSGGAQVVLVTYSDFQCPYCGTAAREIFPVLMNEYVDSGRLKIAFKNLPLNIHPLAPGAAAAAACAGRQRRFWQMHDRLFKKPTRLLSSDLEDAAKDIGVDRSAFESCLRATDTAAVVEEDMAEAARLGISSTPTFIVGRLDPAGRVRATDVLSGAQPVEAFRAILNRLLKG